MGKGEYEDLQRVSNGLCWIEGQVKSKKYLKLWDTLKVLFWIFGGCIVFEYLRSICFDDDANVLKSIYNGNEVAAGLLLTLWTHSLIYPRRDYCEPGWADW